MAEILQYEPAEDSNRPQPDSDAARARWTESSARSRLLGSQWRDDARRVLFSFFSDETAEFLPEVLCSFNPFKELIDQTSTLYDEPVTLHIRGKAPKKRQAEVLGLDRLWAQQQETLRTVRGLRDCYVSRSWDREIGQVRYRVVSPDMIDAVATGADPQQPTIVRELRKRRGITVDGFDPSKWYWCWDVWDFSRPGLESFSVVYDSGRGQQVDLTLALMPELAMLPGRLPYWSRVGPDGAPGQDAVPLWPWTAYHHRISSRLHDPYEGSELVDGTYAVTVLWTFWLGGFRDVSYAQRWLMDADVAGTSLASTTTPGSPWLAMNPMTVLRLVSRGPEAKGQAGAWSSPMDPSAAAKSIAGFAASLALHAGLSPADVSIGSSGGLSRTSGLAIEVSRSGVRRVEGQVVVPMLIADRHNLAHAAQLANAYAPSSKQLPTDTADYMPIYGRTGKTTEEVRAEVDQLTQLVGAGLLHPRDAVLRLRPQLNEEQAEKYLLDAARFRASLDEIGSARPTTDQATQAQAGATATDQETSDETTD